MSILSRYLILRFLGYAGLSTLAFFGLVLATRFHEVARFASLGAPLNEIGLLLCLQFPYVLPFVLPVSILLAAFMLMRKSSVRFELVSLRASGFSIYQIQKPILLTALAFCCLNFWLVSDVATFCHQKARFLERDFREVNPLVFLKKPELLGIKGLEVMTLGEVDPGKSATKSIVALPDLKKGRISLVLADSLIRDGLDVVGHNVLFMTSSNDKQDMPDILLDQSKEMRLHGESFFRSFRKEKGKISVDFLPTPLIAYKIYQEGFDKKMIAEALRRLSMTLEPLTLAFLGLSFGIFIGRHKPFASVIGMVCLVAFNLVFLFLGKSFDKSLPAAFCIYLIPHPILWFFSFRRVQKISRGIV